MNTSMPGRNGRAALSWGPTKASAWWSRMRPPGNGCGMISGILCCLPCDACVQRLGGGWLRETGLDAGRQVGRLGFGPGTGTSTRSEVQATANLFKPLPRELGITCFFAPPQGGLAGKGPERGRELGFNRDLMVTMDGSVGCAGARADPARGRGPSKGIAAAGFHALREDRGGPGAESPEQGLVVRAVGQHFVPLVQGWPGWHRGVAQLLWGEKEPGPETRTVSQGLGEGHPDVPAGPGKERVHQEGQEGPRGFPEGPGLPGEEGRGNQEAHDGNPPAERGSRVAG